MSDKKSLVICLTPLQMVIAEKIVINESSVDLLVIALNDNEKYKYYYENFYHNNINKQYYSFENTSNKFLKIFKTIGIVNSFILQKSYENVYLSSIDNKYIHSILSSINFKNLYTYDDGTANIIKTSNYFKQSLQSKAKDFFFNCLGIKYNLQQIKRISKKHYTIYRKIPNIIEQTEYISIIEPIDKNNLIKKEIKIFLGQPLKDVDNNFDSFLLKKILAKEGVNYHFKHPREVEDAYFEEVKTSYIFEDFFSKELSCYEKVIIYTVCSTAALNIISHNNVEVRLIGVDIIKAKYPDLVQIFIESGAILVGDD